MSKKIFITIISLTLGLLFISLVGYYFILKNVGDENGGISVIRKFIPFGENTNKVTPPTTEEPEILPEITPEVIVKKLMKISEEPIAGFGVINTKEKTYVRYIEKATGHIYETENPYTDKNRISNKTIPTIHSALWSKNGDYVMVRSLKDDLYTIESYGLKITNIGTSTDKDLTVIKFPENITDISVYENSLFYLENSNEKSLGYISNFEGTKRTQIWNSPIKEVIPSYINNKTVSITTKTNEKTKGFMFFIDTTNAQTKKIIGNVVGLSTISNDLASQIIFLNETLAPSLYLFDIKNKTTKNITPTTFPEKCTWSKKDRNVVYCAVPKQFIEKGNLNLWYRGQIQLNDSIWKYDLKNESSSMVVDLYNEGGEIIDVIGPSLSENENYLFFKNKINDSLWVFDLTK